MKSTLASLGIRSFTFGDLDPISPPEFHVDGWDVVMEPRLKVRGFTTLAPDAIGLSMWGLEEQKKLIKQLAKLKARYGGRSPVRLFYQVSDKPLYTLNGEQIVSDALRLCGAENIFAHMTVKAPSVSIEAVLQENPEAIVSGGEGKVEGGVAMWQRYTSMTAVRRDNLFRVNGNLLNRAGPRMIAGTASLCEKIELARQHRKNP